jgi:hypothetical protein
MRSSKGLRALFLLAPAFVCGQTTIDFQTQTRNRGVTSVSQGGTGATTAPAARGNLGLGDAATKPVSGAGDRVPTQSGQLPLNAIPTPNDAGTLVDSGCTAGSGWLSCGASAPSRLGLRQGAAPGNTVIGAVSHDAVLYLDSDGVLKLRKTDGSVLFLSFSPTIMSFVNAPHTHADAANGGALGASALSPSAKSGNGSTLATTAGTLAAGNCVKIDANGNLVDAGAACGGSLGFTALNAASNLADLGSFAAARSNLGLGAAAVKGVQGNGANLLGFSGGAPAANSVAVFDANGNAAANVNNCRITASGLQCGDGTASSVVALPELAASGHGTDSRIYGAASQTSSGCVVWPSGNPAAGQAAVDSGATATMTDGRVCRVLTWQATVRSNSSSSVNGELVVFSGTAGSAVTRASGTGVARLADGVLSTVPGASSDCVKVDGSSGPCGSGGAVDWSDPANVVIVEPFFGTSNSNNAIGAMGWAVTAGTIASTSGEQKHWGVYSMTTAAAANSAAGLELSGTSGSKAIPSLTTATNWTVVWKFKTPADISEWQGYVGLQATAQSALFPPTNGVWMRYGATAGCASNLSDSTWTFVANDLGGSTTKDSGHTVAPGVWYWVRMRNTGTPGVIALSVKADGESWTAEQTISLSAGDRLYNGLQAPVIKHQSCNTTAKTLLVDEFRVALTELN